MLPARFAEVLKFIAVTLNAAGINWVVTGSTAFALRGIPLEPNDIDIQTDREGAYLMETHFKGFVVDRVAFSGNDKIQSHFGRLVMDGVKVEIMGDIQKSVDGTWEAPVDLQEHKQIILFENVLIPMLDLPYEIEAYRKLGRHEKAGLLQSFLQSPEG